MVQKLIKIGFIGSYEESPISGPSVHIKNLLNEFSLQKNLKIIAISKGKKNQVINRGNIKIFYKKPVIPYFLNEVFFSIYLRKLISNMDIDILHFQGISPYVLFIKKKPTIITVHGLFLLEARLRFKGWKYYIYGLPRILMERIIFSLDVNYITVSHYIKNVLAKKTTSRINVIPNGVDSDFFKLGNYKNKNSLLFVGDIEDRKNLMLIIKSLIIVKKIYPNVNLITIGQIKDQVYYDKIMKFILKHHLNSNVVFKQKLTKKELIKEYQECSIFILPSKDEPFGIVLIEAMASGKPVIATNVGAIPSIIQDKINGFIVLDDEVDLANKILLLLNDKSLRQKMGNEGRKLAQTYLWHDVAIRTINYYNNVLEDIK